MGASTAVAVAGIASAAVSAGTSIYSATKSSKSASSATGAANTAAASQSDAANRLASLAEQQWQRYLEAFAPLEETLITESQKSLRDDSTLRAQLGALNRQYANSGANIRSMMGGKNPSGSGLEYGAQRSNELNRTKAVSGAYSNWQQQQSNWENQRLQNMMNVANIGRNLAGSAQSGLGQSAGIYGNMANMYNNLAGMYANQANSAGSSAGSSLGDLSSMMSLLKTNPTTTTGLDTSWGSSMTPYLSGGYGWG